ncbi:RNA polymerase II, subunit F (nucleomorph) [Cryptomonas paramecium]|uniref:RNA polymerase II, subunit F n=1 Tax=Cryptomonas paramaecium TaxID=2898 RepID=F2HI91_9CRYP|nr:RNA polymerase II, subunit F [Cryptomonas paramecium]AEA39015.1 RNA polymerase II, subunit F [Cryptomonas paramecium]|mmetsp:Transcript_35795/g.93913  ORF Transcript_35795/g.93913 Transcript_35795/m.93913 type:complete len:133 (-) Transcript_35795:301-699(-)
MKENILSSFDKNKIMPLFIDEVLFFLLKKNSNLNVFKNNNFYIKIFEYVIFFSKLKKETTRKLRIFMEKKISKFFKHQNLEIYFIICKFIDLMPVTVQEINTIVPEFKNFFNFKNGRFLFDTIFHIIKNQFI